jgi:alkylation response protein AidB-like acyl-CoA dehydrogenase
MYLMGLPFPEAYGGCGVDFLTTALSVEALAYACKDSGLVHAIIVQLTMGILLNLFGNEEQKHNYLVPLCRGEKIAAQATSEAEAGSDVFSMRTKAERKEGNYIIDGCKMFISNGSVADTFFVLARTGPGNRTLGIHSIFIVDKECGGFSRGKPIEKMGLRTLQNCELIFDQCAVADTNLIGKEGQGSLIFNEIMEWERILYGAAHVGTMMRINETCVRYGRERKQFGQPIGKYQSVANKIAKMKINLELARLMVYKAAHMKDNHKRAPMEASIIKVFVSESLKSTCLDAVQIHGGYGYMTEFEIEKDLRDSIASTIYSGTSEINTIIIARLMGL